MSQPIIVPIRLSTSDIYTISKIAWGTVQAYCKSTGWNIPDHESFKGETAWLVVALQTSSPSMEVVSKTLFPRWEKDDEQGLIVAKLFARTASLLIELAQTTTHEAYKSFEACCEGARRIEVDGRLVAYECPIHGRTDHR